MAPLDFDDRTERVDDQSSGPPSLEGADSGKECVRVDSRSASGTGGHRATVGESGRDHHR